MNQRLKPSDINDFLASHVSHLLRSHHQLTGHHLVEPTDDAAVMAKLIHEAPFFVASHGLEDDPILNYGNRYALDLFAMNWETFTQTASRYTAEEPSRTERARLLREVSEKGYIGNYSGVRISADGRRFRIHQATVWNVFDNEGKRIGQAATFTEWSKLI